MHLLACFRIPIFGSSEIYTFSVKAQVRAFEILRFWIGSISFDLLIMASTAAIICLLSSLGRHAMIKERT